MSNKEAAKQLDEIAKRMRRELTPETALATLMAAGIVDSKGNFTRPYRNLEKVFPRERA